MSKAKLQLIRAIVLEHNQTDNPVDLETQVIIITRTFRMLENIWNRCGSEEVWRTLRSYNTK